jgi:GT2 family glycosyltransferase
MLPSYANGECEATVVMRATRHSAGDPEVLSVERARQFWSDHQVQIQQALGRPAFALRLAPPGSARYRLARRILGSSNLTTTSSWPIRLTVTSTPERAPQLDAVLHCAVGDGAASINELNERVAAANPGTWIFAVNERDGGTTPHGIDELVRTAPGNADVVYGDEVAPGYENLTPSAPGIHSTLSYNQLGRSVIVRREAWLKVGGLNPALGSAALADLLLRLVESDATFARSNAVVSWSQPPAPLELGALEQALMRRGITATVTRDGAHRAQWRVALPATLPTVDIVIPTRDRLDLLRQCIDPIRSNTTYQNYRIVVLDNDSSEPATLEYLNSGAVAVTRCPGPFNYASIINRGVAASTADVIVTLNNDVIITDPQWLETLVGYALLPDVGVVGPRLVNGEGNSDHDGITIAPYPQHLQRGVNYGWDDDFVQAIRNVAAVTGACQVFERRKWHEVNGMDESLVVTFNDIDLCLRLNVAGYETLFTPYVELVHLGKASRGTKEALDDHVRFIQYWNLVAGFNDPYCPARLELVGSRYSVRP